MKQSAKILIVDDEPNILKTMSICIESLGHDVVLFENPLDAIDSAHENVYDLAFVDLRMSPVDGMQVLEKLKKIQPHLTIVIITAHGSVDSAVEAVKKGAFDYLQKPFDYTELQLLTERVLEYHFLRREVRHLREELEHKATTPILTRDTAMLEMIDLARRAADSDLSILIEGESGTGKELIANMIHQESSRKDQPYLKINCAALPENLLESELFGHVRGAFTGALRDRKGRFEEADGGTLFLDEITEMSPQLQAKLLRVLQEHEFQRLGENRTRHSDVRILAATNQNLDEAIREGTFREDLFYRLNNVRLKLPPLRERPDDVLLLTEFFIEHFQPEDRPSLDDDTRQALLKYRWPGNVRELQNSIRRAALLSSGKTIGLKDLPEEIRTSSDSVTAPLSLEEVERQHIKKVLHISKDLNDAAAMLGIDPSTLWRKRRKYRL